jgi:hypothetical protein
MLGIKKCNMRLFKFNLLKISQMETLTVAFLLLTVTVVSTLAIIDIYKQREMKKRTKLNLYFMVFYLPLLGPILYYSIFRRKLYH